MFALVCVYNIYIYIAHCLLPIDYCPLLPARHCLLHLWVTLSCLLLAARHAKSSQCMLRSGFVCAGMCFTTAGLISNPIAIQYRWPP